MEAIRRAQLIIPFGVGALHTLKGGITVITSGLDYWFVRSSDSNYPNLKDSAWDDFRITKDQRFIRQRLGMDFLMTPPDYRIPRKGMSEQVVNPLLPVPVFRFPRWHICESCNSMHEVSLIYSGRFNCPYCDQKHKASMRQTRFVAVCSAGHIMDFPWREWVFRKHTHELNAEERSARLHYTPGTSSREIIVSAYSVDGNTLLKHRSIGTAFGAPNSVTGETKLSRNLTGRPDDFFLCRGQRPWLMDDGDGHECTCGNHVSPTLINASNAYFGEVKSSLFIPPPELNQKKNLRQLYEKVHAPGILSSDIHLWLDLMEGNVHLVAKMALRQYQQSLGCSEEDLIQVLESDKVPEVQSNAGPEVLERDEAYYRFQEFGVLSAPINMEELKTSQAEGSFSNPSFATRIVKVMLVERLMETRALVSFSRLEPIVSKDPKAGLNLMRRHPAAEGCNWLPAIEIFGEGIFVRLNEDSLTEWENRADIKERANSLQREYNKLGREGKTISARFIMIHTLAHVLISQISYDCGYSSSSLRERLYVSAKNETGMAGVLIYTADGDSDGTMGGLVRLGRINLFERVFANALEKARWCSSDPVCSESEFQGLNNCNKAACHNCCIISETCCEEMNCFLDRGLLVGTPANPELGFFNFSN